MLHIVSNYYEINLKFLAFLTDSFLKEILALWERKKEKLGKIYLKNDEKGHMTYV
jgi:hypothetical protein